MYHRIIFTYLLYPIQENALKYIPNYVTIKMEVNEMNTEAQKRARQKYRESHPMESVRLELPKGYRTEWKAQATAKGMSLTAYITELVENDIQKSRGD